MREKKEEEEKEEGEAIRKAGEGKGEGCAVDYIRDVDGISYIGAGSRDRQIPLDNERTPKPHDHKSCRSSRVTSPVSF